MLPFLKRHQDAYADSDSAPIARKPDEEDNESLILIAQEFFDAGERKDWGAAAAALKAAFELCDSEPHHEGPHA